MIELKNDTVIYIKLLKTKTKTIKEKLKQLSALIIGGMMTIGISTYAFTDIGDGIDIYFTKQQLLSEMETYANDNNTLREEKKGLEGKLKLINNDIESNKTKWTLNKGKLNLLEGLVQE